MYRAATPNDIAEAVLAIVTPGKVLIVGRQGASIGSILATQAIESVVISRAATDGGLTDESRPASASEFRCLDKCFSCVVWSPEFDLSVTEIQTTLAEIFRVTLSAVLICVPGTSIDDLPRGRIWWEEQAFTAGLRKHPRYYKLLPFEQLETENATFLVPLERIPDDALLRYPLANLRAKRDQHMDMTREAGRQSDAHIARYMLAGRFIQPGDTVVDVGCGLGYGTHIMRCNHSAARFIGLDSTINAVEYAATNFGHPAVIFGRADAQSLSLLADHSVDVVVSFETLDHLIDPAQLVAEAARILKPGGRLIASVRNGWSDDSGCAPNPHCLHVYDWRRFTDQFTPLFLLEHFFAQVAGGGTKYANQQRRLYEVPTDPELAPDSEWCLAVTMLDPVSGTHVPYSETVYPYIDTPENVLSFARDYANPWIVRAMVALGTRTTSRSLLETLATRTIQEAGLNTPDHGAALAVLGYRLVEDMAPAEDVRSMVQAIDRFLDQGGSSNPHHFRWRISLLFLKGKLLNLIGALDDGRAAFAACAALDCRSFSATLGTKTTEAAFLAGWTAYCQGDLQAARVHWQQGLKTTLDLLRQPEEFVGRLEQPLAFLPYDLLDIVSTLHKCANGLAATHSSVEIASQTEPVTTLWASWKTTIDQQSARLRVFETERNLLQHTVRHLHTVAQLEWQAALRFKEIENGCASPEMPEVFNLISNTERCSLHFPFTDRKPSNILMTAIGPSYVSVRNGNQWSYPLIGGFMFTPNSPGEAPPTLSWIGVPSRGFNQFACKIYLSAQCAFSVIMRIVIKQDYVLHAHDQIVLHPGEKGNWSKVFSSANGLYDIELSAEMAPGATDNFCSGVTVSNLHVGRAGYSDGDATT